MINSLFMLGSSYNKSKVISILSVIAWIIYIFIGNTNSSLGLFPIINILVFLSICGAIRLVKNKKVNTILSIFSILIWSIVIDIICYFLYPIMNGTNDIFSYIFQGILFNYKYIFLNIFVVLIVNSMVYINEHIKLDFKKEVNNI